MDEIINQIMAALDAGDFEAAEALVQQAEAAGSESMAKMARMAMKTAKPAPPPMPAPPLAESEATAAKLAAARVALGRTGVDVAVLARYEGEMRAATDRANAAAKRSDRNTVTLMLSKAKDDGLLGPDGDPVTEREHLNAADPASTERFIAHLHRSAKVGILTLSKGGTTTTIEANPGGTRPAPAADDATLLPAHQQILDSFNRGKPPEKQTSVADYKRSLANQSRNNAPPNAAGGTA